VAVPGITGLFQRISGALTARVDRLGGGPGIVGLGTVHAVLPCPIIYPASLSAFAVSDPLRGGLAMFVLGIGTFPTLVAYGTMIGSLSRTRRIHLHRALGVTFCVAWYIPASHGHPAGVPRFPTSTYRTINHRAYVSYL